MSERDLGGEPLETQIERYVAEGLERIGRAAELLGGDGSGPHEDVLPRPMRTPGGAREDAEEPVLDPTDEACLREEAGWFGIGSERDVTFEDAGIPSGYACMKEGGLLWKMWAEQQIDDADALVYVHAGSSHRAIRDQERDFAMKRLGVRRGQIGNTELDAAELVARLHPNFIPLDTPQVLPYGYDIQENFKVTQNPTGQLVQIGTRNQKPVIMLRVDREVYTDEAGKPGYRNQPDTASLMGIIADVLTLQGDNETAVGLVTSNLYASRVPGAIRAGLVRGRQFGVAMYGRATLAEIKGEPMLPTPLKQIPGELGVLYDQLRELEVVIQGRSAI